MKARAKAHRLQPDGAADPRASVVVTCYNYGHFLGCCIDSVLAQSVPAEIIVVNDGSTDDTAAILAGYAGRVTAIETANRGQAAAFNVGFAASSGDIVLFLDADDALHPDALETILLHWSSDLAVLTFGLETIDAAGRSTGVHLASIEADCGDNRPRLLGTGTFAFPPTSGNAFARSLLQATLPMPERDWRISADCYLIRAAALFGRFGHVPRVLGAYRLHGGNNYATGDLPEIARRAENHRTNARALRALAARAETFSAMAEEADTLRAALRERADALLASSGKGGGKKPRPKVAAAMARLGIPRWPVHLPENRWIDLTQPGASQGAIIPGAGDWPTAPRSACALVFTVDPAAEIRQLVLHLAVPHLEERQPLLVTVDGVEAWRGLTDRRLEIGIPLRASPWEARRQLRIDVTLPEAGTSAWQPTPQAVALWLGAAGERLPAPCLDAEVIQPPAAALGAGLDPAEWTLDAEGGATLRGQAARLRFTTLPGATGLVLDFGAPPPRGWLTVRGDGEAIFTGQLGDARRLVLRLPSRPGPAARDLELALGDPPSDDAPMRIAALGLRTRRALEAGAEPPPPLNLGETVQLWVAGARFLGAGWQRSETEVQNDAPESAIAFTAASSATGVTLLLAVEPVLAPGPQVRHLVAVSLGGALRVAVELAGAGTIEVPLPDQRAGTSVRLALHSTYIGETPEAGNPGGFASLVLRSMTLRGREAAPSDTPPPRALPRPVPRLRALIDRGRRALDAEDLAAPAAGDLRAEITALLLASVPAACLPLSGEADAFIRLGEVGRYVASPATQPAVGAAIAADLRADDPQARLRGALLSLLCAPAFRSLLAPDLDRLPPVLLRSTEALARYFGRPPEIEDAAMHRDYLDYLGNLLASIDRILATAPEETALFRLAAAILTGLRSTVAIFGSGSLRDLVRLRSRCIERLLTRRGARLTLPPVQRTPTGRLRLGVLVRDVLPSPEGWALLGMYAGLDRSRFDPVLIRMDHAADALEAGDRFSSELCLAGLPVDAAVEAVRGLGLDLLVTGAYVADWEKTSALLAHRLARLQVWAGAVCPATGGFRSFDLALTCRATEPADPAVHYREPVAWIDGPLQAAYAFPESELLPAAQIRQDLGVPGGARLLVSGATAHKMFDELLAAWAAILAASPDTVLVLYPFAANWSMAYDPDRLRARLDRHLAARGVAPQRATLLWTQPPERVRAIAGAADLYLDSFPYTGATTVCEALSCGTPVLTCAGDALRQLTGASWVRAFGLPELVAGSPAAYVAKARKLLADRNALPALRARLADRLADGAPPHCDTAAFGRAFSDALWRAARDSGRFDGLDARPAAVPDRPDGPAEASSRPSIGPWAARADGRPVQLAILGSPRTGSTLLCRMLNAMPGVICHYELFHAAMIQYMDRTVDDADTIRERNGDPVAFLRRTLDAAAAQGPRLFGFKHFDHDSQILTRHLVAEPAWKIIHLGRRNALAQFSSELIARHEGRWFGRPGGRRDGARVAFDCTAFEKFEAYHNSVERDRIELYAASGRTVLFLEYSTLLAPETLTRLSAFLDVQIEAASAARLPQRQNAPNIVDRFTNPEEVAAYLARRGISHWGAAG